MKKAFFLSLLFIVPALYSMDPTYYYKLSESDTGYEFSPVDPDQVDPNVSDEEYIVEAIPADGLGTNEHFNNSEQNRTTEPPHNIRQCNKKRFIRWTAEAAPYVAGLTAVAVALIRDLDPETQVSNSEMLGYCAITGAGVIKAIVDVWRAAFYLKRMELQDRILQ